MSVTRYGQPPRDLGLVPMKCPEMMLYQYLPVKLAGMENVSLANIPKNLHWMALLFKYIDYDVDDYVYITAKNLWASADNKGNRHGWHSDGFGCDDVSYIWYDCLPTEFAVQNFEISDNCEDSLREFEEQADLRHIVTYPNQHLLKLDETVIHRVSESKQEGFRTFIKINVSKDKYNLKGNSHNYLLDYDWEMVNRFVDRNHPHKS